MTKVKTYTQTIGKVLTLYFVFIVIPVLAFILITSRTSLLFGMKSYSVLTGSMEPKIHVGSMVFALPSKTYNVGDIITFHRGDITVTHRIAAIKNGQFQTKGDANKDPDPLLVSRGAIIGRDIFDIPSLGRYVIYIKTAPGFILLIVLPTIIYISLELKTIKQEIEKEVEKKLLRRMESAQNV